MIDLESNSPPPAPASKRALAPIDPNDFAARAAKRRRPDVSPSYFNSGSQAQRVQAQERPSTGQPHAASRSMLPIPIQARPHSSQSQRPNSRQSPHSQPRGSQSHPQHVSQRQPTPAPDPTAALFRRIMPLAPEQATHLANVWEREHANGAKLQKPCGSPEYALNCVFTLFSRNIRS